MTFYDLHVFRMVVNPGSVVFYLILSNFTMTTILFKNMKLVNPDLKEKEANGVQTQIFVITFVINTPLTSQNQLLLRTKSLANQEVTCIAVNHSPTQNNLFFGF